MNLLLIFPALMRTSWYHTEECGPFFKANCGWLISMINGRLASQTVMLFIQGPSIFLNTCSLVIASLWLHSLPDICAFDNAVRLTTAHDEWASRVRWYIREIAFPRNKAEELVFNLIYYTLLWAYVGAKKNPYPCGGAPGAHETHFLMITFTETHTQSK